MGLFAILVWSMPASAGALDAAIVARIQARCQSLLEQADFKARLTALEQSTFGVLKSRISSASSGCLDPGRISLASLGLETELRAKAQAELPRILTENIVERLASRVSVKADSSKGVVVDADIDGAIRDLSMDWDSVLPRFSAELAASVKLPDAASLNAKLGGMGAKVRDSIDACLRSRLRARLDMIWNTPELKELRADISGKVSGALELEWLSKLRPRLKLDLPRLPRWSEIACLDGRTLDSILDMAIDETLRRAGTSLRARLTALTEAKIIERLEARIKASVDQRIAAKTLKSVKPEALEAEITFAIQEALSSFGEIAAAAVADAAASLKLSVSVDSLKLSISGTTNFAFDFAKTAGYTCGQNVVQKGMEEAAKEVIGSPPGSGGGATPADRGDKPKAIDHVPGGDSIPRSQSEASAKYSCLKDPDLLCVEAGYWVRTAELKGPAFGFADGQSLKLKASEAFVHFRSNPKLLRKSLHKFGEGNRTAAFFAEPAANVALSYVPASADLTKSTSSQQGPDVQPGSPSTDPMPSLNSAVPDAYLRHLNLGNLVVVRRSGDPKSPLVGTTDFVAIQPIVLEKDPVHGIDFLGTKIRAVNYTGEINLSPETAIHFGAGGGIQVGKLKMITPREIGIWYTVDGYFQLSHQILPVLEIAGTAEVSYQVGGGKGVGTAANGYTQDQSFNSSSLSQNYRLDLLGHENVGGFDVVVGAGAGFQQISQNEHPLRQGSDSSASSMGFYGLGTLSVSASPGK